ncbi:unnamed protein product [Medioppia subpectinata]|uniref:6-phosphogluconolactonase n=1 Tax=Medioppia subpectinata TaxID=1979941 RepID=A0A7R9KU95_9ACAR|nr:unnamed protein product [Medioppia subpectinata]CAG2108581.1 unnamed protein product [Medioppia subpectinata]
MNRKIIKTENSAQVLAQIINRCFAESKDDLFCVGVSGGSVPQVLARAVPQMVTEWRKWRLFLCDERLVPVDDPENTFGVYRSVVLPLIPELAADQFLAVDHSLAVEDAAKDYERRVRAVLGAATPDLLLLGMGPDGHTCSLFPNHALLQEKDKWIAAITDSPKPPPSRVTMTLPLVNASKCVVFLCSGAAKAEVLRRVLVDNDQSLPAARVAPPAGAVYWLVDAESARLIPEEALSAELL